MKFCRQSSGIWFLLVCLHAVATLALLGGQASDQTIADRADVAAASEFRISTAVEMVLLDVSVRNRDGGWARGLARESFRVFDSGREQKISAFGNEDLPVTVGLVVDNSGSVRPKRPHIITAALSLVRQSHPEDEFFVINFNDTVRKGLPPGRDFSNDTSVLRASLLGNPAQGRTALYDGIVSALRHRERGRHERKMLVVIADGGDNASTVSREELLKAVQASSATIYAIGIFNPEDPDKNPRFLKKLAKLSGGLAFMPEDLAALGPVCEQIATDIRHRYSIGYVPDDRNFDGKPRTLRVEVQTENGKKLNCIGRSTYVAVPRQP